MEMASTCLDRVLLDLQLLLDNHQTHYQFVPSHLVEAIKDIKLLKLFLICARKWSSSNDLYFESYNDVKKASLPFFLSDINKTVLGATESSPSKKVSLHSCISYIEDVVNKYEEFNKYEEEIDYLSSRSETDAAVTFIVCHEVIPEFLKQIKSFKQEIIQVYITLISCGSLHLNSCMRDDELVEFIDFILQNLVDLLTVMSSGYGALLAQLRALEKKLTFLKSFILFAKLRGTVDIPSLLFTHIEVVVLIAACLSYMCSLWDDAEAMYNPEHCSIICEQLEMIKPVDIHVYEIYMQVLRASSTSASLHTTMMDQQILNNFNDSLISCLWDLLCCSSSFMGSVKDEMQILYAGLRFFRSILREPKEHMDELNEKIGALLTEAGIIICLLLLNRTKEGEPDSLESTKALDFYDMLVNTNIHIKHVKDQISGSSIIGSPPSNHSFQEQGGCKPSSHMPSEGKKPITHEVMVGLDDEAEKVIDRLISGQEHLEIVPVVGMAGLGKTTLAKKVYNDNSIIYNFHIRFWCTVSQEFNVKKLLLQILHSDGENEKLKFLDEDELLQKLYQKLKGNRYLVVFDDIWDIRAWNELRYSFPDNNKRNRILFTSRFSNVASQVEYGGQPHNLRPLTEKESCELLQRKVFGEEDCPQPLCGFGMEIAQKCKGLPLTVVVVAGILATIEHEVWAWEKFSESLTLTMVSSTELCKKSLELSYDYLPYRLKVCLLYFAAFQEDEIIDTKNLMRLWIAEGFVENVEGKRLEDIAEEYMMDLIGRNLVMISERRSSGGVKSCCIHDLLFEFCKIQAKEKNFLQVLRGFDELSTFNEPPNLPRLSIFSSGEDFIKSKLFCPHLRTLLFFDQTAARYFQLADTSFPFSIYKRLNVLKLDHIHLMQEELPEEVESLLNLRYLAIRAKNIPPSIAKISNLETFSLKHCREVTLPGTIWSMKKLRHLHVRPGPAVIGRLPKDNGVENSSTLLNLDTLSNLDLPFNQEGENIMRKIQNIRKLRISSTMAGRNVCCNMSRLESLESLTLLLIDPLRKGSLLDSLRSRNIELSLPMSLKKLLLAGLFLPCSKMQLIEQLPNLEVLKLHHDSLYGGSWELTKGGFTKLRVLTFSQLDIVEWTESDPDSDDYFPCLQQLNLEFSWKLEKFPSCLERISTLEKIKMKHWKSNDHDRVLCLVRGIEESQRNYGNENLKIITQRIY
ncbi:putative late blight resistance protein homolog R1B-14 [Coffea eugenioides]|uniref:putative late blight resistance protein homolog R1B-14 n=1 Tax=Coffea eugenioides TaxID=49369 RepID=UPI000F61167F|nr:putative late blight resistance protein homolog R1B-14 [Coffea eugenioides]